MWLQHNLELSWCDFLCSLFENQILKSWRANLSNLEENRLGDVLTVLFKTPILDLFTYILKHSIWSITMVFDETD